VRLAAATWPQLAPPARRVLLLPLGATEQHGPQLPLETDTTIATALAEAVGAGRPDIAVAPALPYGSSGEHAAFPGTLSLGPDVLEAAVVELVRSADRFDAVVIVSWHGGNAEPLDRAVRRLREEGRRASVWSPPPVGDLHAGRTETSLMLALRPELVGAERPCETTESLDALLPALRSGGVAAVSATGVLGDARGATGEEGRALLAALARDLGAFADEVVQAATPA
jgi:mycofactocin precursor peptide peptidase